jgi:hypothetical protein
MTIENNVIRMKAFRDHVWGQVSLQAQTCDCPEWRARVGSCQHLKALGIYPQKPFVPKVQPTFSQALSALVKSIRLRRMEDAVYWLLYLDTFQEASYRFRTARRLLIGSAEDGHSVAAMEEVVGNFPHICKPHAELMHLVAEAVRICKFPNWWHPGTGGPDYIYSGMVGNRELAYWAGELNVETMTDLIIEGIEEQQRDKAIAGVIGLSEAKMGGTRQAQLILSLAKRYQHPLAERLAEVHLRARSALSGDNNFLCQAAWLMAGGISPMADSIEPVSESEVIELIDQVREKWKAPKPIPGWCCDGIHCAGSDVRFMGMWPQMFAVCQAFEHYGRIDPADLWLPEFQCFDGLMIQEV